MRKGTIKKYENFLAACRKESVILNIRQLAKVHCVSVTFTDWLIKNRYLVKTTGGSYKYMASIKPYSEIVRLYKNDNKPKQVKQPKPEPAGFAYPISVILKYVTDRDKAIDLLKGIGYKVSNYFKYSCIVTNYNGNLGYVGFTEVSNMDKRRYHIDHFDADLIRDIASVRTGGVWVKGEPWVDMLGSFISTSISPINYYADEVVGCDGTRRPTIAEICDYHGYELNGMNIVKKNETKPYPTPIKMTTIEEREAKIISMLKQIESDHGVSYSLTRTETTKTVLL